MNALQHRCQCQLPLKKEKRLVSTQTLVYPCSAVCRSLSYEDSPQNRHCIYKWPLRWWMHCSIGANVSYHWKRKSAWCPRRHLYTHAARSVGLFLTKIRPKTGTVQVPTTVMNAENALQHIRHVSRSRWHKRMSHHSVISGTFDPSNQRPFITSAFSHSPLLMYSRIVAGCTALGFRTM